MQGTAVTSSCFVQSPSVFDPFFPKYVCRHLPSWTHLQICSIENALMWCDGFAKRDLRVGFVVKFNRDQALPRIAPLVTRHLKVTSLLLNEAHPSLRSSETRTPHRLNQPEEASPLCKHLLSAVPRLQAHRSFFQQPALNELQGVGWRGKREWGWRGEASSAGPLC